MPVKLLLVSRTGSHNLDLSYGGSIRTTMLLTHLAKHSELHVHVAPARASGDLLGDLRRLGATPVEMPVPLQAGPVAMKIRRILSGQVARKCLFDATHLQGRDLLRRLEEQVQPDVIWFPNVDDLWVFGPPTTAKCFVDFADIHFVQCNTFAALAGPVARVLSRYDLTTLERRERQVASEADLRVLCSPDDQAILGCKPSHVIPNGYPFPAQELPDSLEGSRDVMFIGRLDYAPNSDAVQYLCHEIWPAVHERFPGSTLHIVGKYGSQRIAAAGNVTGVKVHGFVADARPLWSKTRVLVAPIRAGSGTRLKIVEAWARGRAVVSTSKGAEGLNATDGKHILLADDTAAFVESVCKLLGDDSLAQILAGQAFEYGRRNFSWQSAEKQSANLVKMLSEM
jgi:polysaccharide biosynthesis protein PslH